MRRTDITYQDKLNELRLDISHPNSQGINFIFVEGEADIRLFRKLFNLEKCKVENIPGGNVKVEMCVSTLVVLYPLVIGIRDSDFIQLSDLNYKEKNMFLTDYHDLEVTMLNHDPLLSALIFEHSNISKINHNNLKNKIFDCISLLGYFKWLNTLEQLELNFSPSFHDLISFENQTLNLREYIKRVLSKSPNAKEKSEHILEEKVRALCEKNADLLQLTNGHDLLATLAKYFREIEKRTGLSSEDLAASARMLFDKPAFEFTNLFASLNKWQRSNSTELFN